MPNTLTMFDGDDEDFGGGKVNKVTRFKCVL